MLRDRRLLFVLLAALLVSAPAAVLGLLCVGNACGPEEGPPAKVPFCSLPPATRSLLEAGFRESRSPHVLGVTRTGAIVAGAEGLDGAPWPAIDDGDGVPLVFAGTGVDPGAEVPDGTTLDAVAPTVAEVVGLRRPHPEVRSGEAIPLATGERPRLVLQVVWRGVGARELERAPRRWPVLRGLLDEGAGTMGASVGSRPLDPAAVATTVGTGGPPAEHGITGTLVRNDDGEVVPAWSDLSPPSVIAGLGDDLDEVLGQRPRIGLVATSPTDTGLIGGTWYVDADDDDVVLARRPGRAVEAARELLSSGYGMDGDPDLLVVALEGALAELDAALGELVEAARSAAGDSVLVAVTSTGPMERIDAIPATEIEADVERAVGADVVEATAVGGLFLDQDALAAADLTDDRVVAALADVRGPDGRPVMADAFPALAVTFARYC